MAVNPISASLPISTWGSAGPSGDDINQRIALALMERQFGQPQQIQSHAQGAAEIANSALAGMMYRKALDQQMGVAQAMGSMAFPGAPPVQPSSGGVFGGIRNLFGGGDSASAAPSTPPVQSASIPPQTATDAAPTPDAAPTGNNVKANIVKALADKQIPQTAPTNPQRGPIAQDNRPNFLHGKLDFAGQQFDYGSGGAGRGSIPYGDYPVTPNAIGPWGQAHGAIGINDNAIPDAKIGDTRRGIELHAATNPDLITQGCIAIAGNQWPQFRAAIMQRIQAGEKLSLHVGPDGARITGAGGQTVAQSNGPTTQSNLKYASLGDPVSARGSVFGNGPGGFTDKEGTNTASGIPTSHPGIALPDRGTLNQDFRVTAPNGQSIVAPQTDVGPAQWTGRGIDVSAGAANALGYAPNNFPTDSQFSVQPVVPLPPQRPEQIASNDPNFVPRSPAAIPPMGNAMPPQGAPMPPQQQVQNSVPMPPPRPVESPPGYFPMPPQNQPPFGGDQMLVAPQGPQSAPPAPPQQSAAPAAYQVAQNGPSILAPNAPTAAPQSDQFGRGTMMQMIDQRLAQMQQAYQQLVKSGNAQGAMWIANQANQLQQQKMQLMMPQTFNLAPGNTVEMVGIGPDGQVHSQTVGGNSAVMPTEQAITDAAQYLVNGGDPSKLSIPRSGAIGAQIWSKIQNRASELRTAMGIDAGRETIARQAEAQGFGQEQKTIGTRLGNATVASGEAQQLIPQLLTASAAVDRGKFPTLNALNLAIKEHTGDPNVVALHTAIYGMAHLYARAVNPTGQANEGDTQHALDLLWDGYSHNQMAAAAGQISKEIQAIKAGAAGVRGESHQQFVSPQQGAQAQQPQNSDLLGQARDAISRGAPRDAVIQRLRKMHIDPAGL